MKRKLKRDIMTALTAAMAFILFTAAVMTVDVNTDGLDGSRIGFSAMNTKFFNFIGGFNKTFYDISELCGACVLAIAGCFAIYGLFELLREKSFKKVDKDIYVLAIFYIAVFAFYIIFDKVALNYRPVDLGEGLEPSFPSSHTMLALCICISAIPMLKPRIKNARNFYIAATLLSILAAITVISRVLADVHWLTDIIGGIIISAMLLAFYGVISNMTEKKTEDEI